MTSKLDYLKRYLEPEEPKKKVKVRKKVRPGKPSNVKILDSNIDLKDVKAGSDSDAPIEVPGLDEDGPLVAAVIDERPPELRSFKKTFQTSSLDGDGPSQGTGSSRRRDSSDSDASPVRRRQRRDSHSDEEPPRRSGGGPEKRRDRQERKRRDSSDESPPRRRRGSDESPPRKRRDSDSSPVRRRKSPRRGADSDTSPPRRGARGSPPRGRRGDDNAREEGRREIVEPEVIDGPEVIKLRGTNKKAAAKAEQAEKEARRKAIYEQWNSGVVQKKERERFIEDTLHEASKPLARAADDADLDKRLREVIHADDPMIAFLKKKQEKLGVETRPRYRGPEPPPNRYGIWPGYRWDGVDRSNGFEAKIIAMKNEKLAREEQAYKWSTEDM